MHKSLLNLLSDRFMGFLGQDVSRTVERKVLNISILNHNHNLTSGLVLLGIFHSYTAAYLILKSRSGFRSSSRVSAFSVMLNAHPINTYCCHGYGWALPTDVRLMMTQMLHNRSYAYHSCNI